MHHKPMKEFVTSLLDRELPATYYYHDREHTLYVVDKTIEIAKNENCTEKEIELLSTAALWHDVGYINIYKGHEEESCKLAQQYLPGYGFSPDDIEIISGIIMATKVPQTPHTRLEEILSDADLEYLGTKDVAEMSENLFRELQALNPRLTKEQWNRQQIHFIEGHQYFTNFCREHREPVKAAYLQQLQEKD